MLSGFIESVVVAPVVEETVFRGMVYGSLRARLSPAPSAALSAGLFALAHFDSPASTVNIFLAAIVSALVYENTRSLFPCAVAHATNNALAFTSDVLLRPF